MRLAFGLPQARVGCLLLDDIRAQLVSGVGHSFEDHLFHTSVLAPPHWRHGSLYTWFGRARAAGGTLCAGDFSC